MVIPAASTSYEWNVYSSKKNHVAGHVECTWTTATGCWSEPHFEPNPLLQIHGLASGLNYGQQVYEGLSARRTAAGDILIFRPKSNAARMIRSAEAVSMPIVPEALFLQAVHMAVALNAEFVPPYELPGSMYIRPLQFGSGCQIALDLPDEFTFCVYVQPFISYYERGASLRALVAERFDRAATRGTGNVKVGGNYAPVIRWSREAKKEENGGFNVLLHVDSETQTYVDEFSTSGFIAIINPGHDNYAGLIPKVVLADSPAAIESITSDSVAKLAESFGWKVERRKVRLDELSEFSEVLAVGTAAGLVPIKCIHQKSTNSTIDFVVDGPSYRKLSDELRSVQIGQSEDTFGWCEGLRYGEFVKP